MTIVNKKYEETTENTTGSVIDNEDNMNVGSTIRPSNSGNTELTSSNTKPSNKTLYINNQEALIQKNNIVSPHSSNSTDNETVQNSSEEEGIEKEQIEENKNDNGNNKIVLKMLLAFSFVSISISLVIFYLRKRNYLK